MACSLRPAGPGAPDASARIAPMSGRPSAGILCAVTRLLASLAVAAFLFAPSPASARPGRAELFEFPSSRAASPSTRARSSARRCSSSASRPRGASRARRRPRASSACTSATRTAAWRSLAIQVDDPERQARAFLQSHGRDLSRRARSGSPRGQPLRVQAGALHGDRQQARGDCRATRRHRGRGAAGRGDRGSAQAPAKRRAPTKAS